MGKLLYDIHKITKDSVIAGESFGDYIDRIIEERVKYVEELVEKFGPDILNPDALEFIHTWREGHKNELL